LKKALNKDDTDEDADDGDDGDEVEDDDDEHNKSVASTAPTPKYEVTERFPGSWRVRGAVYRVSTFVFAFSSVLIM